MSGGFLFICKLIYYNEFMHTNVRYTINKKGNLAGLPFCVLVFEPAFDFGSCIKNIDKKSEPTCEEYHQCSNQLTRSFNILFPNVEYAPYCTRKTNQIE